MNENKEKNKKSNYEVLCIIRDCNSEQKNSFIERIKKIVLADSFTVKSEIRKLAYSIEKMDTAEYLLLNFEIDRKRIAEVKEVLKNLLVIRYMMINLDTEKRIKIKKIDIDKLQKKRKFKKSEDKNQPELKAIEN